ncbi:MAG: Asp23/Gls24 family envelope stress response protein [Actinomycetota bacterium]|jgi:uncharacterized alkaline shock family protein YloU
MAQSGTATATRERSGTEGNANEQLRTDRGTTSVADSVVAKIAGIAAREVSGVHAMGTGAARAFGTLKEKLPVGSSEPAPTQGVTVEVGEKEAAVDLDLVVEYGVSIPELSRGVRNNVIQRVERMTGLSVTEVNISVDDIWLGDDDEEEQNQRVH